MKDAATITSPTSSRIFSSSEATLLSQRTPSSLSPSTRRCARLRRLAVLSALASSSFLALVASSSCACSSALRSSRPLTCARTAASFLLASLSCCCACASFWRFGSTSRKMSW
eukprot:3479958-Pleurochrysis_carterae.AAC.1